MIQVRFNVQNNEVQKEGITMSCEKNKMTKKLNELIAKGEILMAPGAYDGITAKLVEKAGFKALYMTGSGVSLSTIGVPDVGVITMTEQLTRAANITSTVKIPLIADIDTGYGGPLNIIRTIEQFESVGVAGVQLEDQVNPKRCGHEMGRKLVSIDEMVFRIRAAVDARCDEYFTIIARTDARTTHGIEEAIQRGKEYAKAGADVVFIESPETDEELKRIPKEIDAPTLVNMVEGGKTPFHKAHYLGELGFSVAIYPNTLTRTFIMQGTAVLNELKDKGTTAGVKNNMVGHNEMFAFFDHAVYVEREGKYLDRLDLK